MNAPDIYTVVGELSQFDNVCLRITSRISTISPDCETLDVPTLPTEFTRDAFYYIYKNFGRSGLANGNLKQSNSTHRTLLATVAHHNKWSVGWLTREWDKRRTGVLYTQHSKSLAVTVELPLASLMLWELGPDSPRRRHVLPPRHR